MTKINQIASLAETIAAHVANVTGVEAEASKIAAQATENIGKARNHALTSLVALWSGQTPVNDVSFKATIQQPMFDAYMLTNAFKSEGTVKNRMHFDKAAIIAITNGILPNAGEVLQAFAKRVGPTLKTTEGIDGKALYTPSSGTKGGRKAKAAPERVTDEKAVTMTRTMALNVLCKGNQVDMEVMSWFTDNMDKARAAYAMLNPIKIK
jgi:hypothetical protein